MKRLVTHIDFQCEDRCLWGKEATVPLRDLVEGSSLGGRLAELAGRSVLLFTHDQLAAALAIIELDGIARRLIICPPDLSSEYVPAVIVKAGVDAIVSDDDTLNADMGIPLRVSVSSVPTKTKSLHIHDYPTEWALATSGTTGVPKIVAHSFASLTAPIDGVHHQEQDVVWGTFYDIRRYGGLQILLRALLGHGSLVLSSADESPNDHLERLAAHSVTHLTGTPSQWRRALMSPAARTISPRYIRLSGEIADQGILNALRSLYPTATIGHAFASTEAGVAFEVNDGLEGFPASYIGTRPSVEIKIEDSSIRIRSARTASAYLGGEGPLRDADNFVDTGDIVELRGDRYYFLGRKTGLINVGGLKVYPEEVEGVLNRHPAVRMSCVRSRKNPITGSIVVADVVLKNCEHDSQLKDDILRVCRRALPRHKVPVCLNFVPALNVAATGKIARTLDA